MFNKKDAPKNTKCLNCDFKFSGWYCPQCSQKAETTRLTSFQVLSDFWAAISDSDKGFLKTLFDLSCNPGQMLNDYVAGKRKRYFSAAKYAFFSIVFFTICISSLEKHFGAFRTVTTLVDQIEVSDNDEKKMSIKTKKKTKSKEKTPSESTQLAQEKKNPIEINFLGIHVNVKPTREELFVFFKKLIPEYHRSLFNQLKLFLVLWIPIFAIFSFLFYRQSSFNFAEHMTMSCYIYSQMLLIFIALSPAYYFLPSMIGTTFLATLVSCGFYFIFTYLQTFGRKNGSLIKVLCLMLIGSTTYLTVLSIALTGHIFWVALMNIERL